MSDSDIILSPHPDEVASHEATAVQEFMEAARTLLQDLRAERKQRRDKYENSEVRNGQHCAVARSAWFQCAAGDVLRRVRTVQVLSQSVTDWNLCAEERIRLNTAKEHQSLNQDHLDDQVQHRLLEAETLWNKEKSDMQAELAQVKAALWQHQMAGTEVTVSPSTEVTVVDLEGRAEALGRVGSTREMERCRGYLVCWRSNMRLEEMMSPRSYAQHTGTLVQRGPDQRTKSNRTSAAQDSRRTSAAQDSKRKPVELSAVVGKCGNTLTSRWVARFVTVDHRAMKIFVDTSRREIKTNIPIHHIAGVKEHSKRAFAIKVKLVDGRSFYLGLQNEEMRQEWVGAITQNISMREPSPRYSPRHNEIPPSPRHMV
eukprot:TRINITY_DN13511_c0_g1_i3.p1 TRINITY_DN13511_c0_g1~~TRINITY_DN13511_c0_g1_i3.p1  ORF type:complete len:371 (+),score=62.38 TRINITY_DN13511_c0_g1_i3:198-1310(+)